MARGRNLQGGGDSSSDAEAVTIKLRRALEENNLKDVKRILSQYFNPTFPSDDMNGKYNPPTFWAAINGSLNVLIELVENYHCKLNYVTHYGQDLLYIACSRGQNEVVRYLAVHHKFDPRKPNRAGITPMFTACYKGHLETVVLLIEELKCDPFDKTPEGDSLLHTACNNGHLHIVSYLVSKHKLNPESRNQHGETPLHLACSSGHLEVVQYLIDELHCEIIVFDNKELTPLHNACRNGRSNVVSYILSKNGDATLFDNTGNTPLHLACCSGRSDVVKILLDSGNVDPNSISLVKQAPIDITHDSKTIRELIKGGAKPVGRIHDLLQHYKNREPLDSMIHIYVIGFGSAGKTTLIKALQRPVNTKSRFYKYAGIAPSHIQGDIPRTSGIVPIEFHSPDFGRVLMFDFAGQHEYHASHEAILEYSYTSTAPIFLLLINMSEDLMEVKRYKLSYNNFSYFMV